VPPSSRKDRGRTKPNDAKGRVRRGRPKVCIFCTEHIDWVDYKDTNVLRRFMSDRGKIKSRANTGTCSQHQSDVALAIKTARELALLPYAVRTLAGDKSAGRRSRGAGRPGPAPGAATTGGREVAPAGEIEADEDVPDASEVAETNGSLDADNEDSEVSSAEDVPVESR
jgi:small subunit ribosomal protein S18